MKKVEQYQPGWKREGFKNRAVKIFIYDKIIDEIKESYIERFNKFSKIIYQELQDGLDISAAGIAGYALADELIKKYKTEINVNSSAWRETIARPVIERYRSYLNRNKEQITNILSFNENTAIRLGRNVISIKKDKLEIKKADETKRHIIDYKTFGTMRNYIPYIVSTGGNLKDNVFVARAKIPIHWKYLPNNFIGIDINKRKDVFCVDSNLEIYPRSLELEDIISQLKKLNKEINSREIKTKQRKRRRLRVQKLHRKMDKLIQSYVNKLIQKTVSTFSCLCIDSITTGAQNGSYGQDKLIPSLIKECENRRIPHVCVPPGYSSRLCSCGGLLPTKARSKDKKEISCPDCGTQDADINGAKNIALFGSYIWQHGLQRFYDWRKGKVDLKKKLVELQK